MSTRKDEMTKEHVVERVLRHLLEGSKTKAEAKRGPTARGAASAPSKFGQRKHKAQPR